MIPAASQKRFWAKVDKSAGPEGCWLWMGERYSAGYGRVRILWRKQPAHRVSLSMHTGACPPSEIYALHSCDVKACVNPAHLRWGTAKDNHRDRVERGQDGLTRSHVVGEAVGTAKLTAAEVVAIRNDRRSLTAIASAYGVSKATVCHIRVRRTWRHIGE